MKLTYRGVSYEVNPTPVMVSGKKTVTRFRGCEYQLPYAVVNVPTPQTSEQIYRGISVSEGKEARFLGQTYEKTEIFLTPVFA